MSGKETEASVLEFREFLIKHPKLIKDVRSGSESWQPYYEKWVLLGESDPYWDKYKQTERNSSNENVVEKIRKWTEEANLDQIEDRVKQWEQTISFIQGFLNQMNEKKHGEEMKHSSFNNHYRD